MKPTPTIETGQQPTDAPWWQPGPKCRPILSLFPGIDLLGRAFEECGFLVVRGPDTLWGQDVRRFSLDGHAGTFAGIIGGPPCQQFSGANRNRDLEKGKSLVEEFARLVKEGQPDWFLMENVNGSPDLTELEQGPDWEAYQIQRLNLNARECGASQNRPRKFHFGWTDGQGQIMPVRVTRPGKGQAGGSHCAMASEGKRSNRRTWAEFCALQGLPPTFDLPGWSLAAKYRAVGNGVPIQMGMTLARAIIVRRDPWSKLCACECGRPVRQNQTLATPSCRKRMQRRRDAAGKQQPRKDTETML